MDNVKEVINALEEAVDWISPEKSMTVVDQWVVRDALALLKAHEPVKPVKVNRYIETDENGDWFTPETYDCGNCGVELHGKANYCHLCGKAVKWE